MRTNIIKSGNAYFIEIFAKNGIVIKYFKFNKKGKYIKTTYTNIHLISYFDRWEFRAKNLTKEEIELADIMHKIGNKL